MSDNGRPDDKAAIGLEKTISESYRLVVESLEILNAKASKLISEIRSGGLTGAEIEARHAEINDLNRHVMHLKKAAMRAEEKLREYRKNNAGENKKS